MKLLVLAHIPPPLHGQSVMVQAMLAGLAAQPGFNVSHVDFRLSDDAQDIGRWRPRKILRTLGLAGRALAVRRREGCDTLYYVPAPPGKRGALYRDWIVMTICRPFFRRLVLHWHAAGLAEWLAQRATGCERTITRALLGRADLAIVLAESLRADAEYLQARRIAIVPNGIADPGPPAERAASGGRSPWRALFLGLCSEEKGLFAAAAAVIDANRRSAAATDAPRFTLVAAGPFADGETETRFRAIVTAPPGAIRHAGFVPGEEKERLFREADCLLFPTRYPAEGLPLVVLEALARDLPIVATRWRAIPDIVPPECGRLVPPTDAAALTDALIALQKTPPAPHTCRDHYLRHFQLPQHLARLHAALREFAA